MANKHKDTEFIIYDNVIDIIVRFSEDVEKGLTSAAIITNKDLAAYALDCISVYAPIRKVDFEGKDKDLYIVLYDNYAYEIKAIPHKSLTSEDRKYLEKIYIDADCEIKQSDINTYLDDCEVVLFGEECDFADGVCKDDSCCNCNDCCQCSEKSPELTVTDDQHGFSVSKSTGDEYVSYSYYSTDKLSDDRIKELLSIWGL